MGEWMGARALTGASFGVLNSRDVCFSSYTVEG